MSLQTATRFRWGAYTKMWLIRAFGASVLCSIILAMFASLGWVGFVIGGVVSAALLGAVLLWTVAEMVEDGLPKDGSVME